MTGRILLVVALLLSVPCLSTASLPRREIQIGYCTPLAGIDAARASGFDYVELRTSEIAALSDSDFDKLLRKVKQTGLQVPVTYLFIPSNIKLTGPAVDKKVQMAYVTKAFDRVAKLGVQVVTFGSGRARNVPDGFPKDEAFKQLVEFCKRIGPEARARRLTIAIEPQRRQECNIINTAAEALELVKAADDPSIQLMIDFYHLAVEKEDPEIIIKARDHIRHLHFANPNGRVFPLKWEEYDYRLFFENLRKIGFDGRISIEARAENFTTEAPQSIAFLRKAVSGSSQ